MNWLHSWKDRVTIVSFPYSGVLNEWIGKFDSVQSVEEIFLLFQIGSVNITLQVI